MALLPLRYSLKKTLTIEVEVKYHGEDYPRPVPFVIDTAAQRTFIVPYWERRLREAIPDMDFQSDATPAQFPLGNLNFKVLRGLELRARSSLGTAELLSNAQE